MSNDARESQRRVIRKEENIDNLDLDEQVAHAYDEGGLYGVSEQVGFKPGSASDDKNLLFSKTEHEEIVLQAIDGGQYDRIQDKYGCVDVATVPEYTLNPVFEKGGKFAGLTNRVFVYEDQFVKLDLESTLGRLKYNKNNDELIRKALLAETSIDGAYGALNFGVLTAWGDQYENAPSDGKLNDEGDFVDPQVGLKQRGYVQIVGESSAGGQYSFLLSDPSQIKEYFASERESAAEDAGLIDYSEARADAVEDGLIKKHDSSDHSNHHEYSDKDESDDDSDDESGY